MSRKESFEVRIYGSSSPRATPRKWATFVRADQNVHSQAILGKEGRVWARSGDSFGGNAARILKKKTSAL